MIHLIPDDRQVIVDALHAQVGRLSLQQQQL